MVCVLNKSYTYACVYTACFIKKMWRGYGLISLRLHFETTSGVKIDAMIGTWMLWWIFLLFHSLELPSSYTCHEFPIFFDKNGGKGSSSHRFSKRHWKKNVPNMTVQTWTIIAFHQLVELEQYTGLARFLVAIRFSYNSYFSASFFSRNSVFLSYQISWNNIFTCFLRSERTLLNSPSTPTEYVSTVFHDDHGGRSSAVRACVDRQGRHVCRTRRD